MAELLQYEFAVVGASNVEKALASLERRFAMHNAKINSMFGTRGAAGGGTRAAGAGIDRSAALAAREQAAALKKSEREQIASARRVERERIAAEKAVGREQERQQKYWALARQRAREHERAENAAAAASRADFVRSTVGRGTSRVFGAARAIGAAGVALTGVGGAALASSAVSESLTLDEMARRTAIQARARGQSGMDPDQLRKIYQSTGIAAGLHPEDIAKSVSRYVDRTGDLEGGLQNVKSFARLSQASGMNASASGDLQWGLKLAGVTGQKDMQEAAADLYEQGKRGSFKLADQAQYLPELAAQGKEFGLHGVSGIKSLGGLLQITQNATGDAAETATGVVDMLSELKLKAADLHAGKFGKKVDVYQGGDAKRGANNIEDIISQAMVATNGDSSAIEKIFGKRGVKPLTGMWDTYKETRLATLKAGGTEAQAEKSGQAAAMKAWHDAADATGDFREVERDAADSMKAVNVELEVMYSELKSVVASELFPAFRDFAHELPALIGPVRSITGVMVRLAEELLGHPLLGLGAILAAAIAAEVLKAKLGQVFEGALNRLTGGSGAGLPSYGGVGGSSATGASAAGVVGAVGTGAAIGVTLATAIFTVGVANFENAEVNMKAAGAALNDVRNAGLDDIEMVRKKVRESRANVADLENPSLTKQASNLITYGSTTNDVELNTDKAMLAEMEKRLAALDALKEIADRLARAGVSQQDAAKQLSDAAQKLGVKMPNTGNSPSPVKG